MQDISVTVNNNTDVNQAILKIRNANVNSWSTVKIVKDFNQTNEGGSALLQLVNERMTRCAQYEYGAFANYSLYIMNKAFKYINYLDDNNEYTRMCILPIIGDKYVFEKDRHQFQNGKFISARVNVDKEAAIIARLTELGINNNAIIEYHPYTKQNTITSPFGKNPITCNWFYCIVRYEYIPIVKNKHLRLIHKNTIQFNCSSLTLEDLSSLL